jgi:hypothetical protein
VLKGSGFLLSQSCGDGTPPVLPPVVGAIWSGGGVVVDRDFRRSVLGRATNHESPARKTVKGPGKPTKKGLP